LAVETVSVVTKGGIKDGIDVDRLMTDSAVVGSNGRLFLALGVRERKLRLLLWPVIDGLSSPPASLPPDDDDNGSSIINSVTLHRMETSLHKFWLVTTIQHPPGRVNFTTTDDDGDDDDVEEEKVAVFSAGITVTSSTSRPTVTALSAICTVSPSSFRRIIAYDSTVGHFFL
jgi:hypothetical protein